MTYEREKETVPSDRCWSASLPRWEWFPTISFSRSVSSFHRWSCFSSASNWHCERRSLLGRWDWIDWLPMIPSELWRSSICDSSVRVERCEREKWRWNCDRCSSSPRHCIARNVCNCERNTPCSIDDGWCRWSAGCHRRSPPYSWSEYSLRRRRCWSRRDFAFTEGLHGEVLIGVSITIVRGEMNELQG